MSLSAKAVLRLYILFFALLFLFSCRSGKSKLVLYQTESPSSVEIRSACKLSRTYSVEEKKELENKMILTNHEVLSYYKFKQNPSLKRSNYQVLKTELIITERCDVNTPTGIESVLTLENIATKKLLVFRSDTTITTQATLSHQNTFTTQKKDIGLYIPELTKRNFAQVQNYFQASSNIANN